jgi:hypothetical protein
VFGGPTYFHVEQAMVSNVDFTSIFGLPQLPGVVSAVSIDTIETEDVDGGAWGYHFGGDVAYFFSRHVGVGGGLRYSEGKKIEAVPIPIDNPVAFDEEAELDTGYFTIAVGMRFRF